MKRTSGRLGLGLVLVSLPVGGCLADGEKNDTSAEVLTQPEVAFVGTKDPKSIVSAVRTQLDRAFVGAKNAFPEAKPRARPWHSFSDVGALVKSTTEFLGNAAITGERGTLAAEIALPTHADGAFRLRDQVSGVAIDVGLEGATGAAREETNGYVVYPAGYADGAHIVHRPTANGTEDYVFFSEKLPQNPELRYKVKLGDGVAGLRLVEQTLEMLDSHGAPRLRMAPPYAIDGDGRRLVLNVAIEGCAYDTSLKLPWDRPTVNPGARECTVHLKWSGDAKAPLVVDPMWSLTNDMNAVRLNATANYVPAQFSSRNRVIVIGGDNGTGTTALGTTEIYDDATNSWTPGPSLATPRTEHAAGVAGGTIHAIGGRNGAMVLNTSDKLVMDMMTGEPKWVQAAGTMAAARTRPVTISFDPAPGRIFVTGGYGEQGQPLPSLEIYDGNVGWSPAGGMMTMPRGGHAMVQVPPPSGLATPIHVLIMGGKTTNGVATASVERCWQSSGLTGVTFECVTTVPMGTGTANIMEMKKARVNHVAFFDTAVSSKKVHVIGGDGLDSVECYNPPANAWGLITTTKMSSPRSFFTVTQRWPSSGKYVVVGGVSGPDGTGNPLKSTDFYDASTETFSPGADLVHPRFRHTAMLLPNKWVLVAGGAPGNVGTAETMSCTLNSDCPDNQYCSNLGICTNFKIQGDACNLKTDCWEGECLEDVCSANFNGLDLQCVDGFCCNAPCSGACEACDGPVKGTCAPTTTPRHAGCGEAVDPCAGRCDGIRSECLYTAGKQCKKECVPVPESPQSTLTTYACDDMGACVVPTLEVSCGNYTCLGTDACNKTCDGTDMTNECILGYQCNQDTSTCIEAQTQCGTIPTMNGPDIDVVQSATMPPRTIDECNGFKCDPITVQCLDSCTTAYDCTTGFTCDSNHACVPENFPTDGEVDDTISCSVSPAHESSRWGWIAALAFAGALATRRNRPRA